MTPHEARARRARGAAAVLVATLAAACAQAPSPPSAAVPSAGGPHAVTYRLEWANDVVAAPAGGFTVTSDLGYTVRVARGWITSYGVELVECPRGAIPTPLARAGDRLWSLIEGTAWAGHTSDAPNPAAVHPMQVESLTDAAASEIATPALAPQAHCKLHYLLARAGADARGLPPEPDMVGRSLHVEGAYRAPGASSDVPFTLDGASAYGALVERVDGDTHPLHLDTGAGAARVTLRRHRAHMFDGVDLAHVPERAAVLQVLRAIVEHVDVRVEPARGGSAS